MAKKTIRDIHLEGRKVLVRCDFNVPLNDGREITDDTRIVGAIPTIQYLIEKGAKVVLCSHLGRPGGKKDEKFSLDVVAKRLSQILDQDVTFVEDSIGDEVSNAVERTTNKCEKIRCMGQILILKVTKNWVRLLHGELWPLNAATGCSNNLITNRTFEKLHNS